MGNKVKKLKIFTPNIFLLFLLNVGLSRARVGNMVCYYESSSFLLEGPAKPFLEDLEPALQFCNTLVYGYAGIDAETFHLKPLHPSLDVSRDHYRAITALKRKHSNLRVLLSVGGDRDFESDESSNKYLLLLEDNNRRQAFINSARNTLKTYGFDGLDLAWQFPKNHPKKVRSGLNKAWNKFKSWITGPKIVDENAEQHKVQFTMLVRELRNTFRQDALMLTLTMLPNVDSSLFIDVFVVAANVDFVNLATFDFQTPSRDPKIADHPAPLYEMYERDPTHCVDHQVQYWLNSTASANIINVGIAAYGRAWVMTEDSGITGYPPVPETGGPALVGKQLNSPGLLSWPEVCSFLHERKDMTGADAPLRKVGDPTHRFGVYAYRAADDTGHHGLWVGYDDPTTAALKAGYVNAKGLGGVALFDLSMDDFRGECAGEKYPMLRAIKYKL